MSFKVNFTTENADSIRINLHRETTGIFPVNKIIHNTNEFSVMLPVPLVEPFETEIKDTVGKPNALLCANTHSLCKIEEKTGNKRKIAVYDVSDECHCIDKTQYNTSEIEILRVRSDNGRVSHEASIKKFPKLKVLSVLLLTELMLPLLREVKLDTLKIFSSLVRTLSTADKFGKDYIFENYSDGHIIKYINLPSIKKLEVERFDRSITSYINCDSLKTIEISRLEGEVPKMGEPIVISDAETCCVKPADSQLIKIFKDNILCKPRRAGEYNLQTVVNSFPQLKTLEYTGSVLCHIFDIAPNKLVNIRVKVFSDRMKPMYFPHLKRVSCNTFIAPYGNYPSLEKISCLQLTTVEGKRKLKELRVTRQFRNGSDDTIFINYFTDFAKRVVLNILDAEDYTRGYLLTVHK